MDRQWLVLREDLDGGGAGPLYLRLSDAIRARILDGRLPVDARLPAERALAVALGVSRNTVVAALDALRGTGFVESRRGAGSRVRLPEMLRPPRVPWQSRTAAGRPAADEVDLAVAAPSEPVPALAQAAAAVADRLPQLLAGTGYAPAGLEPLRRAIADRYTAAGLPTTAGQVLVTTARSRRWTSSSGSSARRSPWWTRPPTPTRWTPCATPARGWPRSHTTAPAGTSAHTSPRCARRTPA